ncbi:MAG: helix-turn-helix domain-containing protein [Candidatus Omnitrophica bacterium]|nr:helix-turn-helix domain-containing protein [Candidatus Omnitrophota bacterium]
MKKLVPVTKEDFLTSTQAAAFLNVSISTFKKYIATKKIKVIKTPGGHYRVSRQALLKTLYE